MIRFTCQTERDMLLLGERFARALTAPALVTLRGGLGAGKTVLVRGLGRALGAADVTSPTFTIVHEYETRPKLYHFDAYRLSGADELENIGFADYLREDALLVMEGAELVDEALPAERLAVTIDGSGADARTVTVTAIGARYERMAEKL